MAGFAPGAFGPAEEYRAAREDAVLADLSGHGRLLFTGRDAADLLHRLTTAPVLSLRAGQGTAAVFATAKGRILDLVTLHRLEEGFLALTAPGRAGAVASWVERYTFREDVRAEDRTGTHTTLAVYGARSGDRIDGTCNPGRAGLEPHGARAVDCGGVGAILARAWPLGGDGYHLTLPRSDRPAAAAALAAVPPGLPLAGTATLEALRLEAGLPAAGSELTEEYNPWEARLDDAIATDKGCYVGQEVIARLRTYRKVARYLVRLRLDGGVAPGPGAAIAHGGVTIGTLTSAAPVPGQDRIVALGYVRDEDAIAGRPIVVEGSGAGIGGLIEGLAR